MWNFKNLHGTHFSIVSIPVVIDRNGEEKLGACEGLVPKGCRGGHVSRKGGGFYCKKEETQRILTMFMRVKT